MIERIKTILLLVLVCTSFYLTYQLWENEPIFEYLSPAEYEQPPNIGEVRDWIEVLSPKEMIFHYKEGKHTKATTDTFQYEIFWGDERGLQDWRFNDVREVRLDMANLGSLLQQQNGLEFRFSGGIPTKLMAQVLNLPPNVETGLDEISRIWVYEDTSRARNTAIFISDQEQKAYEGRLIENYGDWVLHFSNLIQSGYQLPEYRSFGTTTTYYLPAEEIYINQWTYLLDAIDAREMAKVLFLDVSVMREIQERDGSRIFTDGTKSLQIRDLANEMRFYMPTYDRPISGVGSSLFQSIDFINRHEGWTGDYRLSSWAEADNEEDIHFREFVGGYPIYESESYPFFGQIRLVYQDQQVSEYSRSLYRLDSVQQGVSKKIKSGEDVLEELKELRIPETTIREIELAYQGKIFPGELTRVTFTPVYVVHFQGVREPFILQAASEGGEDGLE